MKKLLALLFALLLVTAACGGDGDDEGASTDDTDDTEAPDDGGDDGDGGGGGDPQPGPGFDGTTIKLGVVTPQTGIAAVLGNPITNGNRAYFDRVNAEGGIGGKYKVELVVVDSQYQPQTAVQQFNSIADDVVAVVQLLGTDIVNAVLPRLQEENIVASPASLDSFWVPEQNLLALGTPYQVEAINAMDWYINDQGNENPKACALYQDDPYGEAGLAGLEFASEELDFEIAQTATFAPRDTEFGAQIGQLKGAGCEVVLFTGIPSQTSGVMTAANEAAFTPQWIGQSPTWLPIFAGTGIADYLVENYVRVAPGPAWGDTESEGMAQMIEDLEKYTPDQAPDSYYGFGYAQAWAMAQVLEKAVENGDLSREGVIDAMNNVGTLTSGGLLGDYEYGPPEDRKPPRESTIFGVDKAAPGGLKVVKPSFVSEAAEAYEFEF